MNGDKYLVHLKALEEKLKNMSNEDIIKIFFDGNKEEACETLEFLERYIMNKENQNDKLK